MGIRRPDPAAPYAGKTHEEAAEEAWFSEQQGLLIGGAGECSPQPLEAPVAQTRLPAGVGAPKSAVAGDSHTPDPIDAADSETRGLRLVGLTGAAVLTSMFVHEAGHYVAGRVLGFKMVMTLNYAWATCDGPRTSEQEAIINAAGPAFSVLLMVAAAQFLRIHREVDVLPFLAAPFILRVWPYVVSPIAQQDEARVSLFLGWSPWVVPMVSWLFMALLLWYGAGLSVLSARRLLTTTALVVAWFLVLLVINNTLFSPREISTDGVTPHLAWGAGLPDNVPPNHMEDRRCQRNAAVNHGVRRGMWVKTTKMEYPSAAVRHHVLREQNAGPASSNTVWECPHIVANPTEIPFL